MYRHMLCISEFRITLGFQLHWKLLRILSVIVELLVIWHRQTNLSQYSAPLPDGVTRHS